MTCAVSADFLWTLFKNAKETLVLSNYLSKIKNREQRRLLAKLRLGVLPLEIEKGRRSNLDRSDRLCKLCHANEVEDEIHFLLKCPVLESTRCQFINSIVAAHPNFIFNNTYQQINYLFYNEHLPYNILDISARMLSQLFEIRSKLISSNECAWRCEVIKPLVLKLRHVWVWFPNYQYHRLLCCCC